LKERVVVCAKKEQQCTRVWTRATLKSIIIIQVKNQTRPFWAQGLAQRIRPRKKKNGKNKTTREGVLRYKEEEDNNKQQRWGFQTRSRR
tara:strand:+ start:337 stop:603 length:267 start_codon:yes stop_codon:yes gene_type:complete